MQIQYHNAKHVMLRKPKTIYINKLLINITCLKLIYSVFILFMNVKNL